MYFFLISVVIFFSKMHFSQVLFSHFFFRCFLYVIFTYIVYYTVTTWEDSIILYFWNIFSVRVQVVHLKFSLKTLSSSIVCYRKNFFFNTFILRLKCSYFGCSMCLINDVNMCADESFFPIGGEKKTRRNNLFIQWCTNCGI